MVKIYGIPASNYYSCVKTVLLEKNITFEEIIQLPGQNDELLSRSPMGKVPFIETDNGFLSETNVIYDYIEETYPTPALYPADLFAKSKTKEVIRIVELYLDAPARRHLGKVVFGETLNETAYNEVRPIIKKGLNAFINRAKFAPFVMGEEFSYADIASIFHIGFANFHTKDIYGWDITETHPEIGNYFEHVSKREPVAQVMSGMEKTLIELIESLK